MFDFWGYTLRTVGSLKTYALLLVNLGPKQLAGEGVLVNLKRIERFTDEATFPLPGMELKPGTDAIFAQTRSVMRGWPKSEHDAFHAVSDLVVTLRNTLHITILPDAADSNSGRP
jgi:hypothetical protein